MGRLVKWTNKPSNQQPTKQIEERKIKLQLSYMANIEYMLTIETVKAQIIAMPTKKVDKKKLAQQNFWFWFMQFSCATHTHIRCLSPIQCQWQNNCWIILVFLSVLPTLLAKSSICCLVNLGFLLLDERKMPLHIKHPQTFKYANIVMSNTVFS